MNAMNPAIRFNTPYESKRKAFVYSLCAHGFLLLLLSTGINWHSSTPAGVEVELWDATLPVIEPEIKPILAEKVEKADIAIKKAKEEIKKPEVKPAVKPTPPAPEKKLESKEPPKKADPAAEKARLDQLARLKAAAGAEGGSGGKVGDGVGAGGNAPPSYADKVRRRIKPLIIFNADSLSTNPAVIVLVDLAPDGLILNRTVLSPSTDPNWDRAVLGALERAERFPKDDNGVIPVKQIKLTFKPKD